MNSPGKCPKCRHDYYLDFIEGYGTVQEYISEQDFIEDNGHCSRCEQVMAEDGEMRAAEK
ncbi:MAG TPA: hypothetical protein VE439_06585 [Anaerolineae bacterium]|jgi:predicted nucleic-acid-binding Zn-ribbon protein|nr:hypothetical protein [Anaerolineae bacterium]